MSSEQTPLMGISPSLDMIRSNPTDPAHPEFAGIAKRAQYCLIDAILTEDALTAYAAELRHFPFPVFEKKLLQSKALSKGNMQKDIY